MNSNVLYGFDKVEIISKYARDIISRFIDELRPFCKDVDVLRAPEWLQKYGWQTIIRVIVPTPEFLLELVFNKCILGESSIYCIELFKDIICESKQESIDLLEMIIRYSYMAYYPTQRIYDNTMKKKRQKKDQPTPDKYYIRTLYMGSIGLEFVAYCRLSKVNGLPSVHLEFRIKRASNIRKHTGIKNLIDLFRADPEVLMRKLLNKYIRAHEIKQEQVIKWWTELKSNNQRPAVFDKNPVVIMQRYADTITELCRLIGIDSINAYNPAGLKYLLDTFCKMTVAPIFLPHEFRKGYSLRKLVELLQNLGLPINKTSVDALNKLLRTQELYKSLWGTLEGKTDKLKSLRKDCENEPSKENLVMLNRKLLEEAFPMVTPKTRYFSIKRRLCVCTMNNGLLPRSIQKSFYIETRLSIEVLAMIKE